MATKKKEKIKQLHFCGECDHGTFITKHSQLDLQGRPITLRCKYSEWARVRSERACEDNFKPKRKQ